MEIQNMYGEQYWVDAMKGRSGFPKRMMVPMINYILYGIEPDDELPVAILANDLLGSVIQTGKDGLLYIYIISVWLFEFAPGECWGSRNWVQSWINRRGLSSIQST